MDCFFLVPEQTLPLSTYQQIQKMLIPAEHDQHQAMLFRSFIMFAP